MTLPTVAEHFALWCCTTPKPHKLGPRVDLPPLDQHGPWPIEAGRFVRRRRNRLDQFFETDDVALPYYLDQAQQAWAVADEERARRMAIEEEFDRCARDYLQRPEPPTRFVERKVYTPMPPREAIKKITIERCPVKQPFPNITVQASGSDTPVVIGQMPPAPTLFFGRVGDRIDGWLLRKKRR